KILPENSSTSIQVERASVQRTPSQRSWRHIVAHSASCGLKDRGRKARECGRHSLGIYVARIRGLELRAMLPTAGAVGYNMPPANAGSVPASRVPAANVEPADTGACSGVVA